MRFTAIAFAVSTVACLLPSPVLATSSCFQACEALEAELPGKVSHPNSTQYAASNTYWSRRQSEVLPACFLLPRTTEDVSTALRILTAHNAPFNVKAGGHSTFPSASNIQDGVTVDLSRMNEVSLAQDRASVSVGAGARWSDISRVLDPLRLAVVGGRVNEVGVAGLTLGGGISYLSGRHGWACDNVRNYRVVLASGEAVDANPDENRDLYHAFRGGGGASFGLVTRFDLDVFQQGDIWLHNAIFPGAVNASVVDAFAHLVRDGLATDPDAHSFLVLTHVPQLGGFVILLYLYHLTQATRPAGSYPALYEAFPKLQGAIVNETIVANTSTHGDLLSEPGGIRKTWWDTTFSARDPALFHDLVARWETHALEMVALAEAHGAAVATPLMAMQPISTNIIEAMQKNGGNSLGLKVEDGPLVLVSTPMAWDVPDMDDIVEESTEALIRDMERTAGEKGLLHGFKYMNYAGPGQDVFESYGEESLARLRETAEKYDPEGHLDTLWRGYFQVR